MLYFAVFLSFIFFLLLAYGCLYRLNKSKILIRQRVEEIDQFDNLNYSKTEVENFGQRVLFPIIEALTKMFSRFTPSYKKETLSQKLEKAGYPKNVTSEKWIFKKALVSILLSLVLGLITYLLSQSIIKVLTVAVLSIISVDVLYRFMLARKIKIKKVRILKDLPYVLDLITVSVEAGLSFDGAIARVINNVQGYLSDEFAKALKEMKMGIERKIALNSMSNRCDVPELTSLVTSLVQADELGVSLGNVLRIESSQLREYRKQNAKEKAMKAPIKMLFPLIFFIFPSIFVILLGPAIIHILDVFQR